MNEELNPNQNVINERPFVLEECTKEELSDYVVEYKLEAFQKYTKEFLANNTIEKIIYEDKVIGLIDAILNEDEFGFETLIISDFEIFDKRKGFGNLFMNYFISNIASNFNYIYIDLRKDNTIFWEKVGFTPLDNNPDFTHEYISI